jgi:hypothetical protein
LEAFSKYLSMLTGLKRKEFLVWVNGTEWKDKFSIRIKSPTFIKAIPM